MDTKLKKSHKRTTIIITLCILLPAFLLVSLYPRISGLMQQKKAEYEKEYDVGEIIWNVESNFINYAMESSYYLYGKLLQEANPGETVDFSVLEKYGWVSDYFYLEEQCTYLAEYTHANGVATTQNGELEDAENIGYVVLSFDEIGTLQQLQWDEEKFDVNYNDGQYYSDWRSKAIESADKHLRNVQTYERENEVEIDEQQLQPKNFKITFAIREDMSFVWSETPIYWFTHPESLMMTIGAEFLILVAGIFVAVVALVLPFIKKLETGWEKCFCLPFEIICALTVGLIIAFFGMFYAMAQTCGLTEFPYLEFIGFEIAKSIQWIFLLVVNFLGWAACFFVEYIVITSLRQLLCRPVYYLKNRILCVWIIRWIKKQCVRLYKTVTCIDINNNLRKRVLKIVLANFVVLFVPYAILSTIVEPVYYGYYGYYNFGLAILLWICGIVGFGIYSVLLFVLLCRYGEKVQKQYNSVLGATQQMAEGNLKISMEEELGVFQPIGASLEKVQHGFQKAIIEEAKSQSMKTELITNVSHDLKTPLTAIITYVDLLKREDITEEERDSYIQTLEQKSQRLKVLIEDLFEVSKAQSGNVTMNFMDVDIVNLMKQVKTEMADQIEASNLTFKFSLPEEKVILSLDGQRTYRVFENLLNNALKYAMPYSRVYVDIQKMENAVKVVFRNVSAEELVFEPELLTERFVRGDASRKSEGSGLGLAIAKSFVELQNGKFNIEVDGDLFKVILTWTI